MKLRNLAIAGDFFLLFLFPIIGDTTHEMGVNLASFIRVFVPFSLSWLVIGSLSTAFTPRTIRSFQRTYRIVPPALIISGMAAIVIRDIFFDRPFILSFTLVAIAVTTLLISAWRIVVAAVPGR